MMEEIKQFQSKNGNVTYTVKELIQALHVKIDKMEERHVCKEDCLRRRKSLMTMIMTITTIVAGVIGFIASRIF